MAKPKPEKRVCAFPQCQYYKKGTVLACCAACSADMFEAFHGDLDKALKRILLRYGVPKPWEAIQALVCEVQRQQDKLLGNSAEAEMWDRTNRQYRP